MNAIETIELLKNCIAVPSFSREEKEVSDLLFSFIVNKGYRPERLMNNLIVKSKHWVEGKPVLILNSHIDTVKPTEKSTVNPFIPNFPIRVLFLSSCKNSSKVKVDFRNLFVAFFCGYSLYYLFLCNT